MSAFETVVRNMTNPKAVSPRACDEIFFNVFGDDAPCGKTAVFVMLLLELGFYQMPTANCHAAVVAAKKMTMFQNAVAPPFMKKPSMDRSSEAAW